MRVISSIDFSIAEKDGKEAYILNEEIVYTSSRYGKTCTVPAGYVSDGATGAMDIASLGWWVHDRLCDLGKWDDGTLLSNWQCSQVLQDVLVEEGRYWQSKRWFWATWLCGGGQARKNGMFKVATAIFALSILHGCSTINVTVSGDNNRFAIGQPKTVTTSPAAALTTGDNTIPASLVP